MVIDRVSLKESAEQNYFGRERMQPGRDRFGVFAKNPRAFFDDFHDTRISAGSRFKHDRRQHRDFHFVGDLGPAHQLVQIVQRQRAQNLGGKLDFATVQIVFAQNQAERLQAEKITATGVAQNVSPTTGIFDPLVPTTGNGRAASGVYNNSIAVTERRG